MCKLIAKYDKWNYTGDMIINQFFNNIGNTSNINNSDNTRNISNHLFDFFFAFALEFFLNVPMILGMNKDILNKKIIHGNKREIHELSKNPIKVVELFAGVGGFRLGLEGTLNKENNDFKVIWSNQWEPKTKKQHASLVYEARFGNQNHSNQDITTVKAKDIPDHDMLVGGFPCQDYSVATTLKNSAGLVGKKGVLWWQIHRILEEKGAKKPKYLMLENVDRLLKSPASQRGVDFAIILSSLNSLGYAVEWREINAADYGMPQRRRRIFIMGYHNSTELYRKINQCVDKEDWLLNSGVIANAFPVSEDYSSLYYGDISDDLVELSNNFNKGQKNSPFSNSGVYINGQYCTLKSTPVYKGKRITLDDVLLGLNEVPEEFIIDSSDLEKWTYLKGAKNEQRYNKSGDFYYKYSEGSMVFPDALDKPSRTIITGEGGKSASRFKHVVEQEGQLRRLTPVELERLNMFPDDHTLLKGVSDTKRAFFMGNAFVIHYFLIFLQSSSRRTPATFMIKDFNGDYLLNCIVIQQQPLACSPIVFP